MNRRIIPMILVLLAIAITIAACGKKNKPTETTAVTTEATVATTAVETTEAAFETLEVMYDPQVEDWEDETTAPTETKPRATEPKETTPKATEPKGTEPKETTPKATEPKETQPKETQPKETYPQETEPALTDPKAKAFAEYLQMTPEQQQAYYETFASPTEFFNWYNAGKAAYDASENYIEISGGNIDLGKLG